MQRSCRHGFLTAASVVAAVALASCSIAEREATYSSVTGTGVLGDAPVLLDPNKPTPANSRLDRSGRPDAVGHVEFGRRADERPGPGEPEKVVAIAGDGATLNFVNVDIQEFVRAVFEDVIKESVVIDPGIQGKITVRTSGPVSKKAAIDIVRSALETRNVLLARSGTVYRVSNRGGAPVQGQLDQNIRVIALTAISAEQAKTALQPFTNGQVQISAAGDGRTLLLSGSGADVDGLVQVIGALDVDQLRNLSFALIPLKEAGATAVAQELTQMFGGRDNQSFRVMPIQRVNGVLITSQSRETLSRARTWVRRLDQTGRDARKVNVYQLQNRRAAEVAQILQGIFGTPGAQNSPLGPGRAPLAAGLTAAVTQASVNEPAPSGRTAASPMTAVEQIAPLGGEQPGGARPNTGQAEADNRVSIRADIATNSVVVVAKLQEYQAVETAIRRLDVLPSQVLIEATIVEVGLNDALRHGVRWFLQSGKHSISLTDSPSGDDGQVNPGFNYTFSAGRARVVVNALERMTDVEVISSPALTVLDNQPATLKIGDQVPIATRSARSVTNPDAPTVNEIEMKDTGIILSVTPRVNSNGLVMLDISQEASDVVSTTTSAINSPTIRQRKINSSVAVQSGSEIILGGIISRRRERGQEGVPGLMHIPLIGKAFTSLATKERERTELLIIIRPTVINSRQDLQLLTQEIKSRMSSATKALQQ